MTSITRRARRLLAVVHGLLAVLALPLALVFGLWLAPLMLLGPLWLGILSCRLWRGGDRLPLLLRRTHVLGLAVAVLLCAYGVFALRQAERSAAAGGGLLGAFGLLPLAAGVLLGAVSVVSLWLSRARGSIER